MVERGRHYGIEHKGAGQKSLRQIENRMTARFN
jgi:hypothetical protein